MTLKYSTGSLILTASLSLALFLITVPQDGSAQVFRLKVAYPPVVHPGPARCWETQIRLGFRQPVPGYGRLLAQMPEAATLE